MRSDEAKWKYRQLLSFEIMLMFLSYLYTYVIFVAESAVGDAAQAEMLLLLIIH